MPENTTFDSILSGQVTETVSTLKTQFEEISSEYLNSQLRKFCELEDFSNIKIPTPLL